MFEQIQQRLMEMKSDPQKCASQAGWNIPQEIMGDPRQMVMHLINTNQVGGQALQRVMPMIRNLMK